MGVVKVKELLGSIRWLSLLSVLALVGSAVVLVVGSVLAAGVVALWAVALAVLAGLS